MTQILIYIAISFGLFLFTAYAFAAYIGVRTRWMQLHLATRIIYAPLALIGYAGLLNGGKINISYE